MLIIYNKNTGEVVEGSVTNSMFPLGIPDASRVIENVVERFGGTSEDYAEFRLHDVEDAETINLIFTHEYRIENNEIVFGDEKVIPEPEPQPPSIEEQLAEKDKQIVELKEKQLITSEIVEINGLQQQELLELLIDMGVI